MLSGVDAVPHIRQLTLELKKGMKDRNNYYRNNSECMIHTIADMNNSDLSLCVIAEIQDYKPQPRFGPNLRFLSNLWNKFWVMLAEEGEVKEKNEAVWEKRFDCCLLSFVSKLAHIRDYM